MNTLQLFLPCAAGVEDFLADEVHALTGLAGDDLLVGRGGVVARAPWREVLRLNLYSRLAQRVLVQLAHAPYRVEADIYEAACAVAWEAWFTPRQSFKIDVTAQHSPLKSLNFAALKVKDAVADRFRARTGARPSVDTARPEVRIYAHLSQQWVTLYIDSSGQPLFKRGWRADKGDAPLKETLAAAVIAASGWRADSGVPLYDPCCGSGTIAIEAAQMACHIAPGLHRRFAFEHLAPYRPEVWNAIKKEAGGAVTTPKSEVFGSDVSHRMVDFAQRNAERAGVAQALQLRGGDALQRLPPCAQPGLLLLNPPYGERIATAGVAGARAQSASPGAESRARGAAGGREGFFQPGTLRLQRRAAPDVRGGVAELADTPGGDGSYEFFRQLAAHWKSHYGGWTAWVLTPDPKLPGKMRLKESRRVPLWNGPIECRLLRFDLSARQGAGTAPAPGHAPHDAAERGNGHRDECRDERRDEREH